MKYNFKDISTKRHGVRTLVQVNRKSLENEDLFVNVMFEKVCRCGRNCTDIVFHDLLPSSQNLKYRMNRDIPQAEMLFDVVKTKYMEKLVFKHRYFKRKETKKND